MPSVSVVIPTFNKLNFTKKCLNSIFKYTPKFLAEIIVVDNGSTDGTTTYLKGLKGIKRILNTENLGFAKACNIGAKASKGDYILFLNNDTEVQKGWLEPMIETIESSDDIAIVGSKLLFPSSTIQHAGVVITKDLIPTHIHYNVSSEKPFVNKKREFQAVTAACLLIKKKDFEKVGGFDEEYINGYEDVDLCLKIKELNKKIVYDPRSVVIHHESISEGRFNKNDHNTKVLFRKWGEKLKPDIDKYLFEDGMLDENTALKKWVEYLEKDIKSLNAEIKKLQERPLNKFLRKLKEFRIKWLKRN